MSMNAKFIVIDGTDGSGKATQTKLLVERMKKEGILVETISFPQYGQKSAGPVEEYLSGKYGTADEVGPFRASTLYAVDRFDASFKIRTWLEEGKYVIADRFVGSNMGHQGSKISDPDERASFFKWAMEFEHETLGIPRPDMNLILRVPSEVSNQLLKKRTELDGIRSGLKKDVHESDPDHLAAAEQSYLDIADQFNEFHLIECCENDKMIAPEIIHETIWKKINTQ